MAATPDPNEVLLSTSGKANFQRLARLLISGGSTLLREVFDQICKPTNLPTILKNPATEKQLKAAKLTKPQWDCLYPSPGLYGKSVDFDVTLLFQLLRTICSLIPPATGWDALPTSTDHSLAADLARVKYYRNSVYGHVNQKMEVSDDEFLSFWQEISEALVRIAGQISPPKKREWQLAIINFLKKPLTAEDERNGQELKEWYRNDMEVKESIEELKFSTHEVQSGLAHLETTVQEKVKDMKDKLGEEAREIKDQLGEVKDRLNSSTGGTGVPGVQLQVKIDCKTIPERGPLVGASEMFLASQRPQAGAQESAVVPIASDQLQTEATGAFGVASSGNYGLSPQEVLSFIAYKCFQPVDPSNPEQLNGFLQYMEKVRKVLIVGVQSGSLILTVECGSLEILERLWKDYCTGYLNEMAQKYLVTEDILKEFGLAEVKLTTTILEEEYRACREYFLQHSALPPAPETSTKSKESDPEMTSGGIQVFAKETLTGKELRFNVLPSNTIKDVKNKIHEKTEIPLEDMRLFCAGKLLADNYTLIDYNFQKKLALHLAVVRYGVAMEIHVKIPSGDTITLTVFPEDTIWQVKKNLANKAAMRTDLQLLTFDGKELGEDLTLSNHSIQHKSVLHLARRSGTTMPIHVRVPRETTITLDVLPSTTIRDVKAMIAEKQGIPLRQQRLIFLDKELQDYNTLSDYNIRKESTLDVIHRIDSQRR